MREKLNPLWILVILKCSISSTKLEDLYDYVSSREVNAEAAKKEREGIRLVGARTGNAHNIPFIVGIDLSGAGVTTCTGSLIAPKWILTAAHCTALINEKDKSKKEKCLKTGKGRTNDITEDEEGYHTFNCKELKDGSFEYSNINPKGKIWLGLNNANKKGNSEQQTMKRIIRHKNTYFGGASYGKNGGYDISLLEMEKVTKKKPACLPSPTFNDNIPSKLAGYGRFLRDDGNTCQTDEQGLMKFHYCEEEGDGSEVCKKKPPPNSRMCRKFFKKNPQIQANKYKNLHSNETMTREIRLIGKKGNVISHCFQETETNKKRGWCKTKGNYYNPKKPKEEYKGWGFCGEDCFLTQRAEKEGAVSVLRVKDHVDVLSDKICNKYLDMSLEEGKPKTRPQILCVGYKKNVTSIAYTLDGKKVVSDKKHFGDYFNKGFYVTSGGTCNGDSGGPLYLTEGSKFIVTGSVSGGRGNLGKCGGINNPVHYVRIKIFTKWILKQLAGDRENVCWDEAFQKKIDELKENRKKKRIM